MNRIIDEPPMPDIVRSEYGMRPASAEPFREDDGATGIPVAGRGRQSGTAALKACSGSMFSPAGAEKEYTFLKAAGERRSEAVCNPCCNGARGCDKDDCNPDGYTDVVLRSILNKEDGMDFLVETASFDEVDDYYNPGVEEVERAFVLESLVIRKNSSLEKVICRAMIPAMRKHMKAKDPTTGDPIEVLDPIIGKPRKTDSFAYVTAQIPFSDGQVVSIIFHASEGDGRQIGPSDVVVAFRWLLNKRDITSVVAPENGGEVTFETVSLRLAQLAGKNAKRFASTQKEVQEDKKKLEELEEIRKEREEQTKVWEDKITGNRLRKEESDANNSRLEAKLARQLEINRELEDKLVGLKKMEEEARKNGPEPKGETEKATEQHPADDDSLQVTKVQIAKGDNVEKPLYQRLDNTASVFRADQKEDRKVPENAAEASEPQTAEEDRLLETKAQVAGGDNVEKTQYQRLADGEFNKLPYDEFYYMLLDACDQECKRLSRPDEMLRLAVTAAASYLDASYASIADALKWHGVYGKSIAENLLKDSKTMVSTATDVDDIFVALEYAFHARVEITRAIQQLDDIAAVFRAGEKKLSDIYTLSKEVEAAPWTVQKIYLTTEENADIADFVRQAYSKEFERRVFKDRVAVGEELLDKVGFIEKVAEKTMAGAKRLKRTLLAQILAEIKEKILQCSCISQKEAEEWVNSNVSLQFPSPQKMRKLNTEMPYIHVPDLTVVKNELANIYRITNGKLNKLYLKWKPEKKTIRSSTKQEGESYKIIWRNNEIKSLYHEVGHIFEYTNPCFLAPARRFIKDRASGEPLKLQKIAGKYEKYRDDEMVLPDNFSDKYVGKLYYDTTEVLSMGLQVLSNEVEYAVGMKDMEHLKFCFGCFAPDFTVEETDRHKKYSGSIRINGVSSNQKLQDFLAAVDNAIPDYFREQLSQKGVEKFRTVKTTLWDGSQDVNGVILKYGRKIILTIYSTEEGLGRTHERAKNIKN